MGVVLPCPESTSENSLLNNTSTSRQKSDRLASNSNPSKNGTPELAVLNCFSRDDLLLGPWSVCLLGRLHCLCDCCLDVTNIALLGSPIWLARCFFQNNYCMVYASILKGILYSDSLTIFSFSWSRMQASADTPERGHDDEYKPGQAGREFLEEVESLRNKVERKIEYKRPKPRRRSRRSSQPKINKCFQPKRNEDGYPLKHCEFEPLENRQVYRPPGYAEGFRFEREHCVQCHLKPCITVVYCKEAREMMTEMFIGRSPHTDIADATQKLLLKRLCKHMKKRYSKKVHVPECIIEGVAAVSCQYRQLEEHRDVATDSDSSSEDGERELGSDTDENPCQGTKADCDVDGTSSGDEESEFLGDSIEMNHSGWRGEASPTIHEPTMREEDHSCNDEQQNNKWKPSFTQEDKIEEPYQFLTQPPLRALDEACRFSAHEESSTDEECEDSEQAFLEGRYIPRSMIRDRDTGDAPLEDIIESHRRRIVNQRANRAQTPKDGSGDKVVKTGKSPRKNARKRKRCVTGRRKQQGRSLNSGVVKSNKPFTVDHITHLESDSDSDEEEMRMISQENRRTFARIRKIVGEAGWDRMQRESRRLSREMAAQSARL